MLDKYLGESCTHRLNPPYWKIRNTIFIEIDDNNFFQPILKALLTVVIDVIKIFMRFRRLTYCNPTKTTIIWHSKQIKILHTQSFKGGLGNYPKKVHISGNICGEILFLKGYRVILMKHGSDKGVFLKLSDFFRGGVLYSPC